MKVTGKEENGHRGEPASTDPARSSRQPGDEGHAGIEAEVADPGVERLRRQREIDRLSAAGRDSESPRESGSRSSTPQEGLKDDLSMGLTNPGLDRRRHSLGPKMAFKMENKGKKRAFEELGGGGEETVEVERAEEDFLGQLRQAQEPEEKRPRTRDLPSRRHSLQMGTQSAEWREFSQRMNTGPQSKAKLASAGTQTDADILKTSLRIPRGIRGFGRFVYHVHDGFHPFIFSDFL